MTWGPNTLVVMVFYFLDCSLHTEALYLSVSLTYLGVIVNSMVNPVIYWFHLSDFRKSLNGLICSCSFRRK